MVNLMEQIMLNIYAKDNASNVANKIDSSFQGMAGNISNAMQSMSSSMMNFSAVSENMMQGLTGKSAMENILGTSSKAETNKVLLNNMTETKKGAEDLYNTVDKVTDSSLTSMQELIPAMKAFKSATGASDKEMMNITDDMANFGAAVLAQTGSTDLAQQSMMDLSKGIKGAFAALDQYGITEESLRRTGYWNGDEKDVEGFMKAVTEVTGSTEELMKTNQGLDALIGKAFSRAGKKMGNEFLPVIKDIKQGFLDLDDEMGGNLTASILAASAGIETMNTALWNVSTTVQGIKDLGTAFSEVKNFASSAASAIKNMNKASESASDALNIGSNISDVAKPTTQYSAGATDILPNTMTYYDVIKSDLNMSRDERAKAMQLLDGDNKEVYKFGKLLEQHNNKLDDALATYKKTGNLAQYEKDVKAITKEKENLFKYIEEFGEVSTLSGGVFEGIDVADDIADSVKDVKKVEDSVEGVVEAGTAMGALGAEAAGASAGIEGAAVATTSISAAFTEMIVPLLAISAVIAIMIPIAAALAAEAMLFLKLLADFMSYLDFGSVDLKKSIDGIKEISEALAWIGVAMASLVFTNIMTGLATMTSGFMGMTGPLKKATAALSEVAVELQNFSVNPIDTSVVENLKGISESLGYVSNAMMSLTNVNITTGFSNFIAWALKFGSIGDGLAQAKSAIENASTQLKNFNVSPLPKEQADNIQNVCNSLASVGGAMSALTSIRDSQNWDAIFTSLMEGLFGEGVDIQTALWNVQDDIQEAGAALAAWGDIPDIPEGIGEKLQKVGDALGVVSETINKIWDLRDDVDWEAVGEGLFGGSDVKTALESIKNELITAANSLSGLAELPDINTDITTKITNVGNGIKAVSEVMGVFAGLTGMDMTALNSAVIATAVANVKSAATELSQLNETTFNADTANSVLNSIKSSLENLRNTLASTAGFTAPAQNIGTQIVNGVRTGMAPLGGTVQQGVASGINSASGQANSGGSNLGSQATNGFKSTLKLAETMAAEVGHTINAVTSKKQEAYNAGAALGNAFHDGFESAKGINVGSPGKLAHTMMDEVAYIKEAITSKYGDMKNTAAILGGYIVNGFNKNNFDFNNLDWNSSQMKSLETLNSNAPPRTSTSNNVTLIVAEGAVTVDARNKTTQEAKSILTLALEGLDHVTNIEVDGA